MKGASKILLRLFARLEMCNLPFYTHVLAELPKPLCIAVAALFAVFVWEMRHRLVKSRTKSPRTGNGATHI